VSTQTPCAIDYRVAAARSQRKVLLTITLTLLLAIPGTAKSFTLDQLLDMPIEQLLGLEITSAHPSKLASMRPPSRDALQAVDHRDAT
jgi:hypothetical protein